MERWLRLPSKRVELEGWLGEEGRMHCTPSSLLKVNALTMCRLNTLVESLLPRARKKETTLNSSHSREGFFEIIEEVKIMPERDSDNDTTLNYSRMYLPSRATLIEAAKPTVGAGRRGSTHSSKPGLGKQSKFASPLKRIAASPLAMTTSAELGQAEEQENSIDPKDSYMATLLNKL